MTGQEYKWQDVFTQMEFKDSKIEFPLDFCVPGKLKIESRTVVERDTATYISEVADYITVELECFGGEGSTKEEAEKNLWVKISKRSLDLLQLAANKKEDKIPDQFSFNDWRINQPIFIDNIKVYNKDSWGEQTFVFITDSPTPKEFNKDGKFYCYLDCNFLVLDTRRVSLVENMVS